jgi:hypothetical protein
MSELKVNKLSPASGTAFTLGDSGDTFTIPSGATFTNSGTATGFGGGKILQVISAYSTVVQHTAAVATWTDLTGMTVTITPSATASKIWIMANITGSVGTTEYGGIRLIEGGSAIGIATGITGSQTPMTSAGEPTVGGYTSSNMPISWIASPATTSAVIYKIQMYATGNVYMNRTVGDVSSTATPRTVSTITAIELESATVTGT